MNYQEENKKQNNNDLRNMLLAVALLMGFVFIVSIVIYFIKENYGLVCGCGISLPLVIAVLTSLGVFVGILTYYFFSKSYSKEKERIFGNIEKTLNFLDQDEKTILLALINNKGELSQSKLSEITKIDAVKLYRRLSNLESKSIIRKKKSGMTNKVILDANYTGLFIK